MTFRWIIMVLALAGSLLLLLRNSEEAKQVDGFVAQLEQNFIANIHLGLDLRGGIFMQLEVDGEDAVDQYIEEQAGSLKGALEDAGYTVAAVEPKADIDTLSVLGAVAGAETEESVKDVVERMYGNRWVVNERGENYEIRLKDLGRQEVTDDAVKRTVTKIQNRIDELGVTEPSITRVLGTERIVLELAGADDTERVHNIVKEPGKLEWRMVHANSPLGAATEADLLRQYNGVTPPGTKVFTTVDEFGKTSYLLLDEVKLTARNVNNVFVTRDGRGLPAVGINLNRTGGQTMFEMSENNIGGFLAVVLDGKVVTYPRIEQRIGESFIIRGNFTPREVEDTVVKLKSGSLPAEIRILEERAIGPTLGRDAIRQGTTAAIAGLLLVVLFILLYYKRAGVYAFFALFMNLIIILGMLSGLNAVLTLPGIAGFILTIGMAVDANVLVFERIREELLAGAGVRHAVDVGYKTAFVTIMDANVTTFIAAFCLLLMGEGPVKGFAIMLMIGIVSSIFTAVFCSRTFFLSYLNRRPDVRELAIWPIWGGKPGKSA